MLVSQCEQVLVVLIYFRHNVRRLGRRWWRWRFSHCKTNRAGLLSRRFIICLRYFSESAKLADCFWHQYKMCSKYYLQLSHDNILQFLGVDKRGEGLQVRSPSSSSSTLSSSLSVSGWVLAGDELPWAREPLRFPQEQRLVGSGRYQTCWPQCNLGIFSLKPEMEIRITSWRQDGFSKTIWFLVSRSSKIKKMDLKRKGCWGMMTKWSLNSSKSRWKMLTLSMYISPLEIFDNKSLF